MLWSGAAAAASASSRPSAASTVSGSSGSQPSRGTSGTSHPPGGVAQGCASAEKARARAAACARIDMRADALALCVRTAPLVAWPAPGCSACAAVSVTGGSREPSCPSSPLSRAACRRALSTSSSRARPCTTPPHSTPCGCSPPAAEEGALRAVESPRWCNQCATSFAPSRRTCS